MMLVNLLPIIVTRSNPTSCNSDPALASPFQKFIYLEKFCIFPATQLETQIIAE